MLKLYDHQVDAIKKMHNGCVLDGGVGSGKSITALSYYLTAICGATLENNEININTKQKDVPLYIITTARKRDTGEWDSDMKYLGTFNVVIDSWNNIEKYKKIENAFFIFDEQRACGHGKWARTFIKISKRNQWIMLSATPGDSWIDYIPVFIANGFYKSWTEFNYMHVSYDRYAKYPKIIGYRNIPTLIENRNKVLVHMFFERPTTPHDAWRKVTYDNKKYKEVEKNRWNPYENKPIENISEYCSILRRISNESQDRYENIKTIALEHNHSIVFYNFNYELDLIKKVLNSANIKHSEWNGHVHEEILNINDPWCYIVQYSAGSEGWNCTTCDTVIFASLSYSYKQVQQAKGRIDRLNTKYKDLWYYFLYSGSSIDRSIKQCLERKEDFNETAFWKGY